ncbi:MAG TPA: polysaccharide pyruvyl transferase family protein, partial [Ruminococcus sp.]|nr:polysaccharide pyruvyl transferase family protein [Ruminococcus sp.]
MNIGIITWFQYYNYGTSLQLVALSKTIESICCQPNVLKYYAKERPVVVQNSAINEVLLKLNSKLINPIYTNEEKDKKFLDFYQSYLSFTESVSLMSDLQKLNDRFDAFVCGSDQIWAPSCFDPHFFLDFVFDDNKKIAYAPSVGLPTIEDKHIRSQIKHLTKRIRFLSTREESGSKIISELCGRNVQTVLDPTLLLNAEQWQPFCKDVSINEKKPYLLVYMLGKNEWQWKVIYKIAGVLNLAVKVIPVFKKDLKRQGCIKDAGIVKKCAVGEYPKSWIV